MKIRLVAASLTLVVAAAAGCGGGGSAKGSDAPKDASKSDFCGALEKFSKDTQDVGSSDKDIKGQVKKVKDAVKALQKVGTPKDIDSDARKGFEAFIDDVLKLPDDATKDDLENFEKNLSKTDTANLGKFFDYTAKECPDLGASGG